jgi:DNA topoisomerase IB
VSAIERVAGRLGNTAAVCKKSYIHPSVFDAYTKGGLENVAGDRQFMRFLKKQKK